MRALSAPKLNYRPMQEQDLSAVMAIEQLSYQHPWTSGIFQDCLKAGYSCWLLEEGVEMLGYGVISAAVGEAHLLNLCIHPAHQGRGLGRSLLEHLLKIARYYRAETLFLEVRPSNKAAYQLYVRMGFNEVGMRRNYYPAENGGNGREDALIMALSL